MHITWIYDRTYTIPVSTYSFVQQDLKWEKFIQIESEMLV